MKLLTKTAKDFPKAMILRIFRYTVMVFPNSIQLNVDSVNNFFVFSFFISNSICRIILSMMHSISSNIIVFRQDSNWLYNTLLVYQILIGMFFLATIFIALGLSFLPDNSKFSFYST